MLVFSRRSRVEVDKDQLCADCEAAVYMASVSGKTSLLCKEPAGQGGHCSMESREASSVASLLQEARLLLAGQQEELPRDAAAAVWRAALHDATSAPVLAGMGMIFKFDKHGPDIVVRRPSS